MKMLKGLLFVALIICIRDSLCALDAAYDAGKEVWKLYSIIEKISTNVTDAVKNLPNDNAAMNEEIKNQMDEIHKQLDQMEKFMHPKIIHDSFKSWPYSILLYKSIDTLEIYISSVDAHYEDFRRHINETGYPSEELEKFMESISSDVDNNIQMIRSDVIDKNDWLPDHRNLIFAITAETVFLPSQLCNSPQTSRILVQLLIMVMIAEMKGHVMFAIGRSYQLPRTARLLNIYTKEQFERQLRLYVHLFSLNIPLTDSVYVRACDPIEHNWIRGESFYEFEGTFQTAIFHYNYIRCHHQSCNDVQSKKSEQCDLQYYDDRSGCSSIITECVYLDVVQACVLKRGAQKFQYVSSMELGLLGTDFECPQDSGYIIGDGMSWNATRGVCACKCHGNDNKIGLFMMQSHVENNMVITGIRFIRQYQMIYIQPREGKLEADGRILSSSERWIRIPKDIPSSQIHSIDEQNKIFFFDDVRLPAGFALIGVRFNHVQRRHLMGFAIEIWGVPFDYRSGKLNLDPESLMSMQPSIADTGEPLSFKAVSSIYAHSPQRLSPTNKKYVVLQRSELKEDFGQSTLPLFDAVPVTTHSPSVLGGVGIFHKGVEGYAGFISLRIYGVRYAQYFLNFTSNYVPYIMTNDEITSTN